jgi:hypothetical protein
MRTLSPKDLSFIVGAEIKELGTNGRWDGADFLSSKRRVENSLGLNPSVVSVVTILTTTIGLFPYHGGLSARVRKLYYAQCPMEKPSLAGTIGCAALDETDLRRDIALITTEFARTGLTAFRITPWTAALLTFSLTRVKSHPCAEKAGGIALPHAEKHNVANAAAALTSWMCCGSPADAPHPCRVRGTERRIDIVLKAPVRS